MKPPNDVEESKGLTRREIEVLHLSAEGLTAKQIGGRLCLSDRTVSLHRSNAYRKLGVGCLLEAVRRCAVVTFRPEYALTPEEAQEIEGVRRGRFVSADR